MSAPVSTESRHVAALNLTTHRSTRAYPTRAELLARADPRTHPTAAPRPLQPRPQPAEPTPAGASAGTQQARWSLAGIVAVTAILLAQSYLTSMADHYHAPHRRPHQHRGDDAAGATRAAAAQRNAHSAPAAGASDQPLAVYPHPHAE